MTKPTIQPLALTAEQFIAIGRFSCHCGSVTRASAEREAARERLNEVRNRDPQSHEEIDTKLADTTKAAFDVMVYETFDTWRHCTCPGRPR